MKKKMKNSARHAHDMRMIADQYAMRSAFYAQIDPRRRQEVKDSYMISEDHTAFANLPEQFIHREFNAHAFKYSQQSAGAPWAQSADEIE